MARHCEHSEWIEAGNVSVPICNYPGEEGSACIKKCQEGREELQRVRALLSRVLGWLRKARKIRRKRL